MDEMKIVLVADLHLGYNIGEKQMRQMVERINEQNADLVVIAGDIFDNEWEAEMSPRPLPVRCAYPVEIWRLRLLRQP